MDAMTNLKAFVATARTGSFSRAARELGVAPSVVTKRVGQLEHEIRRSLFVRSTRRVELTDAGRRFLPRVRALISDFEDTFATMRRPRKHLEGHIRIKSPTTLTVTRLGGLFGGFQSAHPLVSMEVVLIDGPVNPIEEGYDVAIGAFAPTFPDVVDVPLCPLRRVVCAAPAYLNRRGHPKHPRNLVTQDCLVFTPSGTVWDFTGPQGPISVEVRPRFASNDGQLLVAAAVEGNGIGLLSRYACAAPLRDGRLVPVLPDYAVPDMLIKAVVPEAKIDQPVLRALLAWLAERLAPATAPELDGEPASTCPPAG
ncbi:LysR family transcriptional regulator [Rhodoplanes sp. TEM]|uniref:LysR family transcriptional regulator n=1 Tax=Rhodoplanes tepidamans TaxID=200616 RepID=A0ABT5J9W5_RHOTP|nr:MULTISPECIES: LysR family transcriptional regulator [Rhodoplanes]MDC7786448.1 LysR family transcriptional regulator [Rhodoplanes tepidamans]MDC7985090.1 LysR family transcriptional regulator [Rhodoplanes sp. TEM]MDQ0357333.1 DNA-binding transcriptional LysR family regulator [Rhodoplanes tepidamans]